MATSFPTQPPSIAPVPARNLFESPTYHSLTALNGEPLGRSPFGEGKNRMMSDVIVQEQAWVQAARAGDRQAFSQLVESYSRPVYNLTYRMLGNPQEAEDAAQETFLRAYSRLGQYDSGHKFSTWLFSIANHYCIDRLRKRRTVQISIDDNPVLENLEDEDPLPETSALTREQSAEVQRLLAQLDPDYRTPLVLRYWEDLSYEEIAETMNVTVPAVKSRLFRARQRMAELLAAREATARPPAGGGTASRQTRRVSGRDGAATRYVHATALAAF
jgi:RNA polymerase sigma-70 factor, ECF subfamily